MRVDAKEFKRVQSATPLIAKFKIPKIPQNAETPLITIENYDITIYPHILRKREAVDHLEAKLLLDWEKEFVGLDDVQRDILLRILNRNVKIGKRVSGGDDRDSDGMTDRMYTDYLKAQGIDVEPKTTRSRPQSRNESKTHSRVQSGMNSGAQSGNASRLQSRPQSGNSSRFASRSHSVDPFKPIQSGSSSKFSSRRQLASPSSMMSKSSLRDDGYVAGSPVGGESTDSYLLDLENRADSGSSGSSLYPASEYSSGASVFNLEFPTNESKLISEMYPLEKLLDPEETRTTVLAKKFSTDKKRSLRQIYGKIIDPQKSQDVANSKSELEYVALQEMKKVSQNLQSWVKDILDNSINLDPKILQQVHEGDDTRDAGRHKREIPDVDISGFNILLNACKPAILETGPQMKLNASKENGKRVESASSKSAAAVSMIEPLLEESSNRQVKMRNPWYMPPTQWTSIFKTESEQHKEVVEKKPGSLGVVQQKLDEIASKREVDEAVFQKEMEKVVEIRERKNGALKVK